MKVVLLFFNWESELIHFSLGDILDIDFLLMALYLLSFMFGTLVTSSYLLHLYK